MLDLGHMEASTRGYALIPQDDLKIHFWAAELALCTDLPLWLNALDLTVYQHGHILLRQQDAKLRPFEAKQLKQISA